MKQNNYMRKALLLLALVAGVNVAWADGTINIPQDWGSYILIGNASTSPKTTADGVTLTDCQVDGEAESSYTVGSAKGSTVKMEFDLTAEAGNYIFSFKSGAKDASTVSLSLTNSSSEVVWSKASESIEDTDSWDLTKSHNFIIGDLPAGNYTMTITGDTHTGEYYGNFGNFSFHKSSQYADNWNNTSNIIFTYAVNKGNSINNDWINGITVDSYVEFYTYAPNDGYYFINCTFGYATADIDNFTLSVTDVATDITEVNEINYIYKNTNKYLIPSRLKEGWKKFRIVFPGPTITESFRCQGMRFGAIDALPLTGTATLNLNQTGVDFNNCSYQDDSKYPKTIGSIKGVSPYADNYYVYNYNTSAYDVKMNINYKNTDNTTVKVTISNASTGVEEATGTSNQITETGDIQFSLNNPITPGVKKIRFDFISDVTSAYLINITNVSFSMTSSTLNENYDYAPVAATDVDIDLTRNIAANKWSTIVLPFAMTADQITNAFGDDTKVAMLSGKSDDVLHFTSVNSMDANKPYLIKVNSDFTSATIYNVNIEEGTPTTEVDDVEFVGSYKAETEIPASAEEGEHTYYFISNNTLYSTASTGTANKMRGTRAYFKVPTTAGARQMSFTVDEESGETTGISSVNRSEGIMQHEYFDLQGRKVAQPAKGLYIVNGKKVVIK